MSERVELVRAIVALSPRAADYLLVSLPYLVPEAELRQAIEEAERFDARAGHVDQLNYVTAVMSYARGITPV